MAEQISDGDDHIRLVKSVLRSTFPDVSGPALDPIAWMNERTAEIKAAEPSRPWGSIPARSSAPAAVQAIRIRRLVREAVRNRSILWSREAEVYLQHTNPDDPRHQWAVTWLGGVQK